MSKEFDKSKPTLFLDLDNTLIFSRRKEIRGERVPAEYLYGREQSYMSKEAYDYLRDADWLNVVPVTTRTEKQLNRVFILSQFGIKYTMACNGGQLFVDGKEDDGWTNETNLIVAESKGKVENARHELEQLISAEKIHCPKSYMCYAAVENPNDVAREIRERTGRQVTIQTDTRKVYIIAPEINKGMAIKRFCKRFSTGLLIAAGDSQMDVPMFKEVNYALASCEAVKDVNSEWVNVVEETLFSDELCDKLDTIRKKIDNEKTW